MKRKFVAGIIFLLAIFATSTNGFPMETQGQCPALPPEAQQYVQRTLSSKPGDLFAVLKNGMTVLIRQKLDSSTVSAQIFVRAGSVYEGKYMTAGLSHYLEHVVSGGSTKSFTETEAKDRLQSIGGVTNAYTSYDRTVYYINTSSDHWRDAVDLLTSYVSENVLDPAEVQREKAVIQQEFKLGENDVSRELWKLFINTAYQTSPIRNPVIGHEEVFVRQNREALEDYYLHRYQPGHMVVAVVGNIPPLDTLKFIAEKTSSFSRRDDPPEVLPPEPPQTSARWAEEELPFARLYQAMIGFPSVSLHHKDLYSLDVLAFLLGEGETCRLYCRLKDQERQVLSVHASNWTPSFVHGQFTVSLTMAPQFWPGVLQNMVQELNRFKTELVPAEELDKAKKATIARHVFGKETASDLAASLASSYFDTGDPYFDESYVEGIRRVTPEEIQDAAKRYLDMDRSTVALIRPQQKEDTASAEPISCKTPKPAPVSINKLENGMKILLKEDSSLPVVNIQLYGLGGILMEGPDQPGISSMTASLLTSGTKQRSRLDILRSIEDVGGYIESTSDNSTYHVSIKVLKDDLDKALDILSDIAQNSILPEDQVEKKRQETLLAIRRMDENWQTEIMRLFKKNYFHNSPYQHDRLGTEESVKSFSQENLVNFYHRMVNPRHSVLSVYGDIKAGEVLLKIQSKFADWHGAPDIPASLPEETQQITSSETIEKKNDKVSAALFIGTNGIDVDSARRPTMDVLDALLSGAGTPGGRLFEALRGGKEDLVYLVGAFPFYGKKAGYFGVISQTTMANVEKVQKVILDNLNRMTVEPVPEQELETAKNMILTAHRMDLESLGAQAQNASVNEILGLGWDYEERYGNLIRSVKAEDVQRLAKEIFKNTLTTRTVPEKPVEILAQPGMKDATGGTVQRSGM